jgi:hypothetical protein
MGDELLTSQSIGMLAGPTENILPILRTRILGVAYRWTFFCYCVHVGHRVLLNRCLAMITYCCHALKQEGVYHTVA